MVLSALLVAPVTPVGLVELVALVILVALVGSVGRSDGVVGVRWLLVRAVWRLQLVGGRHLAPGFVGAAYVVLQGLQGRL